MVNGAMRLNASPLLDLVLSYAPASKRPAFAALLALDSALGQVLRTTREPMVGQMRLAWWREALEQLDFAPAPGEPVLQALAAEALPRGVDGAQLAQLVDGWEPLLGDIDAVAIAAHADLRGAVLFKLAGALLAASPSDPVLPAGKGWALVDLANNLSATALSVTIRTQGITFLRDAYSGQWSPNARALGALALLARAKSSGSAGIAVVLRLGWHRLTGR